MAWLSISQYCKKKGIKNRQVVYNRIYLDKIPKDQLREIEITIKRKQIWLD